MLSTSALPNRKNGFGGLKLLLQIMWNESSKKQSDFMPNGNGIVRFPHFRGQPGKDRNSVCMNEANSITENRLLKDFCFRMQSPLNFTGKEGQLKSEGPRNKAQGTNIWSYQNYSYCKCETSSNPRIRHTSNAAGVAATSSLVWYTFFPFQWYNCICLQGTTLSRQRIGNTMHPHFRGSLLEFEFLVEGKFLETLSEYNLKMPSSQRSLSQYNYPSSLQAKKHHKRINIFEWAPRNPLLHRRQLDATFELLTIFFIFADFLA